MSDTLFLQFHHLAEPYGRTAPAIIQPHCGSSDVTMSKSQNETKTINISDAPRSHLPP
uniref:Uncharacterized protein n=1 Tax=Anguilla anguilla TaxID=7936 RepID=A0A0E9X2E9_ANGAN